MKILLGMPTTGMIPMKTVMSLLRTIKKDVLEPMLIEGSLIHDSRDHIAKYGVENGFDYVLYVDSDMVYTAGDVESLVRHNTDVVSGLYVTRHGEGNNVAYEKVITRQKNPYREPKLIHDIKKTGYDEVEGIGFGFCLIKTSMLRDMFTKYPSIFEPKWGLGEDLAFCYRARKMGYKIMLDRDVKVGHIGSTVYEP